MSDNKSTRLKVLSFALVILGTSMLLTIPAKMIEIESKFEISDFGLGFARFSFYLIAVLCIVAGIFKLKDEFKK